MSPQELFDTVVGHLHRQGMPAIDETGQCSYRGYNGTKCAAGVLIPNEYYDPEMDERNLNINIVIETFKVPNYIKDNHELVAALQEFHDYTMVKGFDIRSRDQLEELKFIAKKFNLNFNTDNYL